MRSYRRASSRNAKRFLEYFVEQLPFDLISTSSLRNAEATLLMLTLNN